MQESRKMRLERERKLIVRLHDQPQGYSFEEISALPEFRRNGKKISAVAIYKRYKRQKGVSLK